MIEAADSRRADDLRVVVVRDEFREQPVQVPLAEDDHVIEQISPRGRDPAFRRTVLPGAVRRDLLAPDAHVLDHGEDIGPVLLVVVEDEL